MDFTPEEGVPLVLEKGTTFPIQKDAYGVTDAEATWKHVKASVVSGIGRRGFKERLVVKTRKMSSGRYTRMEVRCFAQGKPGGTTSQKTDCKLQVAITWPATAPPSITIAILEHSRGCRMEEVAMVLNNRNLTEEHDSARMRPLPAKRKRQHQIPCRGREAMSEETATVPVCITASHDRGQGAETQKEAENALESFDAEHGTGNQAQGEEPEAVAEARMEATAAAEEVHAEAEAGAGMERDEHTLDVTRNETRVRFEMSISDLDVKTRDVLMGLFEGGHILDGIESFGEDNKNDGFNNGMFSCFVGMRDAPEAGSRRSGGAFWRHGTLRKRFSENAFIACMKALIPFVLDGDAPVLSPMGEMMLFASRKGGTRLGHIGKKSGRGPLNLNPDLTDEWRTGAVSDEQLRGTLNGGTLTIDNTEVDKKTDRTCSATLKNDAVTRMIREETRMGQLCFPRRSRHRGGSLTGTSADGVAWGGSECMLFAKDGGMTNPHVDVQSVPGGTGKIIHMPAAGIIRKVNHADTQGPAKQAIVVHADDMSRVIETLKIDTGKESTSQYSGKLQTLPEFARVLRGAGIRFVVMSFPARCSYALPAKCAHVFITIGLVESSAWHPVFSQKITCSA